jgi:hypothetical protein
MKVAGYGHFLGMFHVGNLPHEKVMSSKRLFAEHIMPELRQINVDAGISQPATTARGEIYEVREAKDGLALYRDFNYVIDRDALEVIDQFVRNDGGKVVAGWEMRVPEREPNGFPYQIIFSGPTREHRGSAIRLRLCDVVGDQITEDADVLLEAYDASGANRQMIFQGKYDQFRGISDQHAPNAAVAAQRRVVAEDGYVIRLTVSGGGIAPRPDPTSENSFFELECFKHLLNVTA